VETAADFRESNRAARLLADDACMAHTRCPAGLLFRSHTTETAESLRIMTSSTVQCSHSSWTTSLSSLHGSFPLSCLKNKQRWQSHRWRSMLEHAITRTHSMHLSHTHLCGLPDLETSLAGFEKLGPSVDPSNAHLRGVPLEQARSDVP